MTAKNTTVSLTQDTWTLLSATSTDITSVTFMVKPESKCAEVLIAGTASESAPTDHLSAIPYAPGQGERNAAVADLFPGITAVRIYGKAMGGSASVFVSHA